MSRGPAVSREGAEQGPDSWGRGRSSAQPSLTHGIRQSERGQCSTVELQEAAVSEVKNRGIAAIQKVPPEATAAAAVCGLVGAEPREKHSATREATAMRSPGTTTGDQPLISATRENPCSNKDPVQPKIN